MTAPKWITPAGPIVKPITSTEAVGSPDTDLLFVSNSTNISAGQLVEGYGISPGTTVVDITDTTTVVNIRSISAVKVGKNGVRTPVNSPAVSKVALITFDETKYPPFVKNQSITISDVHKYTNGASQRIIDPDGAQILNDPSPFNGASYQVVSCTNTEALLKLKVPAKLNGSATYTRPTTVEIKRVELFYDTLRFVVNDLGTIAVGQAIKFDRSVAATQTATINNKVVAVTPLGGISYEQPYTVNTVDTATKSFTVRTTRSYLRTSDGTDVFPQRESKRTQVLANNATFEYSIPLPDGYADQFDSSRFVASIEIGSRVTPLVKDTHYTVVDTGNKDLAGRRIVALTFNSTVISGDTVYNFDDLNIAGKKFLIMSYMVEYSTSIMATAQNYTLATATAFGPRECVKLSQRIGLDTRGVYNFNEPDYEEFDNLDVEIKVQDEITGSTRGSGLVSLVSGRTVVASSMVDNYEYKIKTLGNTDWSELTYFNVNQMTLNSTYTILDIGDLSQIIWNRIAGTEDVIHPGNNLVYKQGDVITCHIDTSAFPTTATVSKSISDFAVGDTIVKKPTTSRVKVVEDPINIINALAGHQYRVTAITDEPNWNRILGYNVGDIAVGDYITPVTLMDGEVMNIYLQATGLATNSNTLRAGSIVKIVDLGILSNAEWNWMAGTSGITYTVGSSFLLKNKPHDTADVPGTGRLITRNAITGKITTISSTETLTVNTATPASGFQATYEYLITSLGLTSQEEWNRMAGTTGIIYKPGDEIVIVNAPTTTLTGTVDRYATAGIITDSNTLKVGSTINIVDSGILSNAEWNTLAGTSGIIYKSGDEIVIVNVPTDAALLARLNGAVSSFTVTGSIRTSQISNNNTYIITKMGTSTQTQWNVLGNSSNKVYQVGSVFTTNWVSKPALINDGNVTLVKYQTPAEMEVGYDYLIEDLGDVDWNYITDDYSVDSYSVGDIVTCVRKPYPYGKIIFANKMVQGARYRIAVVGDTDWDFVTGRVNLIDPNNPEPKPYRVGDLIICAISTAATALDGTDSRVQRVISGEVARLYTPQQMTVSYTDILDNVIKPIQYQIVALGNANWNAIAGTIGYKYGETAVANADPLLVIHNKLYPIQTDGTRPLLYARSMVVGKKYEIRELGDTAWSAFAAGSSFAVGQLITCTTANTANTSSGKVSLSESQDEGTAELLATSISMNQVKYDGTPYTIYFLGRTNWNLLCNTYDKTYAVGDVIYPKYRDYDNALTDGKVVPLLRGSGTRIGNKYQIKFLGNTDWNLLAGTSNVQYQVSDIITIKQMSQALPVTCSLLNGKLPTGDISITYSEDGVRIKGRLGAVNNREHNVFTLRATFPTGEFSDRTFWIDVRGRNTPIFLTKPGALGNQHRLNPSAVDVATPPVTRIVMDNSNVFVSIAPLNLEDYRLTNNTAVFLSGLTSFPEINNKMMYINNANVSTGMAQLYGGIRRSDYITLTYDDGIYPISHGTISGINVDSVFYETQLKVDLPVNADSVEFSVARGNLPAGLEMGANGYISGYPLPPTGYYGEPITTFNNFDIEAKTSTGSTIGTFIIPIMNQETAWSITSPGDAFPGRQPVLLNNAAKTQVINGSDPYYSYYFSGNKIGTFTEDTNLQFKMLGYDWNREDDQYNNQNLIFNVYGLSTSTDGSEAFVTLNTPVHNVAKDGWITGTLSNLTAVSKSTNSNVTIKTYKFSADIGMPSLDDSSIILSDKQDLNMTITSRDKPSITWLTDGFLGSIANGKKSRFNVEAKFSSEIKDGEFKVVKGRLPANLEMLKDGTIIGRVLFQPEGQELALGRTVTYEFDVEAYSKQYADDGVAVRKTFRIDVNIETVQPYDNLYVTALLTTEQRLVIKNILKEVIARYQSDVYRPSDLNYGVARNLKYGHAYGVPSQNARTFYTTYAEVIKQNHYFKNLSLGNLKTAVARESNGEIVYEVVYAPIIDRQVKDGVSVKQSITWSYPIIVNDKTLDSQIYPNSLVNMREQLSTFVGSVNDVDKLPLWMTSQQLDGSTTGYIPAWVLCYTKPGKSETILKHLNTFLVDDNVNMNSINFAMDRFEVDRSMSFTWGTTTDDSWPTIKATMSTSLGQNISVSSLTGIEINQPIRFTNGANTANVLTDNTYYVSEINPNFEYQTQASRPDGSTFAQTSTTQTIKVRNSYYGTSVDILTPGGDTLMDVQLLPTSAFSNDDTEDTYIVFEQETILKK